MLCRDRAVPIPAVERDRLLETLAGRAELPQAQQRQSRQAVTHREQRAIVGFSQVQDLVRDLAGELDLRPAEEEPEESGEREYQLGATVHVPAELVRPREFVLDRRGRVSPGHEQ